MSHTTNRKPAEIAIELHDVTRLIHDDDALDVDDEDSEVIADRLVAAARRLLEQA